MHQNELESIDALKRVSVNKKGSTRRSPQTILNVEVKGQVDAVEDMNVVMLLTMCIKTKSKSPTT